MSGAESGRAPAPERERLLSAFIALAASRGPDGLETGELVARAGVDLAAFQRHFDGLDSCFDAAWEKLESAYLRRLQSSAPTLDWRTRLRSAVELTLSLVETHPTPARFIVVGSMRAGELGRERQRGLVDRLNELIAEITSPSSSERGGLPEGAAGWIVATVFDRTYRHLLAGTEAQLREELPELMFLVLSPLIGSEAALSEL